MTDFTPENITKFLLLFKRREDVFAVRWEKSGKYGYMPAYQYDVYHYRVHKMDISPKVTNYSTSFMLTADFASN